VCAASEPASKIDPRRLRKRRRGRGGEGEEERESQMRGTPGVRVHGETSGWDHVGTESMMGAEIKSRDNKMTRHICGRASGKHLGGPPRALRQGKETEKETQGHFLSSEEFPPS